jgi:hypothetical protein
MLRPVTAGYTQESTRGDQPAPDSVEEMKGPLHEGFRRVLRTEPLFPGMPPASLLFRIPLRWDITRVE